MIFEVKGDIFESPVGSALAHCISSDGHMRKGIAANFVRHFPALKTLRKVPQVIGIAVPVYTRDRCIFNLVTKVSFKDKPLIRILESCLISMKRQAIQLGIGNIWAPRLGCGLDRLNYNKDVKPLLCKIFNNTDVNIVVNTMCREGVIRYVL